MSRGETPYDEMRRTGERPPELELDLPSNDCVHDNADHLHAGDFYNDAADACFGPYEARFEQFRCIDCGAWLSLGPSRDGIPKDEMFLAQAIALVADMQILQERS